MSTPPGSSSPPGDSAPDAVQPSVLPKLPSPSSSGPADVPRFRPRACARCSVSKLKCNWLSEPGEAPCERCARSKSVCVLPSLKPRGPRRGNPTRVGQLEQKIDGIMSLLTASQQAQRKSRTLASAAAGAGSVAGHSVSATPAGPATPPPPLPSSQSSQLSQMSQQLSLPSQPQLQPPEQLQPSQPSHSSQSPSSSQPPPSHPASDTASQPYLNVGPPPPSPASPGASKEGQTQQLPSQQHPSHSQRLQHSQHPHPHQHSQQRLPSLSLLRIPPLEHVEVAPGLKITFYDADLALMEYRSLYAPFFPFVALPSDLTAFDLYQADALLFCVLVQVVVPQPAQVQRDAKHWFREQIAHQIVVQKKRRLALLQALLVHIVWSEFGHYIEPQNTPLLQLAIGLVIDLGLHRSPSTPSLLPGHFLAEATEAYKCNGPHKSDHDLQDMRACLGCYYVCALSASLLRRTFSLPFTPYMGRCCDALLEAGEYETDRFLVALVQMHRIASRIHAIFPNSDIDSAPSLVMSGPHFIAMASLRRELDNIVESQPAEVKKNCPLTPRSKVFLWMHYRAILMRLYEPAVHMPVSMDSIPDASAGSRRTEMLWNCLQATRDFFEVYLDIPISVLGLLPSATTGLFSFGLVTATSLLFIDDGEWDAAEARRSLDLIALFLRLEDYFKSAEIYENSQGLSANTRALGRKKRYLLGDNRSMTAAFHDKMRWIRLWYTSKASHNHQQQQQQVAADASNQQPGTARTSEPQPVPPPSGFMDTDMDGFGSPSGDFENAFWKAIFDLDGSCIL